MDKKTVAIITMIGGLTVFVIKLMAYFTSNSVALLSDALESIVNIFASGMMILSVYISEKPADESHKYGHQKIEDISSAFEGILIIVAAILIVNTAIERLFSSFELLELNLGILISILATAMNAGMSLLLIRTAKSSGSMALEGDAKHLLSDVLSTVGVWIGLILLQITGWQIMDPLLAFVVAALIIRMGLELILKSIHRLMDRSAGEAEDIIKSVLKTHSSDFIEFHDLKTRKQGNLVLGEVHLTVHDSMSVREAHDIIDKIDNDLKDKGGNIDLTVHIDPESEMTNSSE